MLMPMVMTPRCASCVDPSHPRRTIRTPLALPDRYASLDAIDELPACAERFYAVRCARCAHDRDVPNAELTDAMDRADARALDLALQLRNDLLHLALRHVGVGGVIEAGNG